jgi:hypothetical protein
VACAALSVRRAPLDLGGADEALVAQTLKALQVGRRQVTLRGRAADLRARGIGRQLVIGGIDLRQQLAGLHALAQFHRAPRDLAGDAKTQARLNARAHVGRVFVTGLP